MWWRRSALYLCGMVRRGDQEGAGFLSNSVRGGNNSIRAPTQVSGLVLIEQGMEFQDEAGLPFRHQDLDLSGFLVDLEILDQPKRLAPPLILHQDPERQFDVRLHARPGLIQFSGERIRLRGLKFQKILQLLVKPHGMLTSQIILISLKYDPGVPRVPWPFGIPPAVKSDQPATT